MYLYSLIGWIKALLSKVQVALPEPPQENATTELQKVYKTACAEIGTMEIIGPKHNHRIIAYHSSTTLAASQDEVPWCASFVCWCLEQNGIKSTKSAAAKSYLLWGERCEQAEQGCVVVASRGEGKFHVAFFSHASDDGGTIYLLGGNQNNSVNISGYPLTKILAYRKPATVAAKKVLA